MTKTLQDAIDQGILTDLSNIKQMVERGDERDKQTILEALGRVARIIITGNA